MNEPLKFKLFSVYGKILHKDVLTEAFRKVKKNKGCAGIDKISIKMFEENLDENIELILNELRTKTYKPSPVRRKYIPKKNGKLRPLGIPTIKDRVVQQALVTKLEPFFEENVFHDNSCGFRPNRDVKLAIKKIVSRLESGYLYIYDFDIKGPTMSRVFCTFFPQKGTQKLPGRCLRIRRAVLTLAPGARLKGGF